MIENNLKNCHQSNRKLWSYWCFEIDLITHIKIISGMNKEKLTSSGAISRPSSCFWALFIAVCRRILSRLSSWRRHGPHVQFLYRQYLLWPLSTIFIPWVLQRPHFGCFRRTIVRDDDEAFESIRSRKESSSWSISS